MINCKLILGTQGVPANLIACGRVKIWARINNLEGDPLKQGIWNLIRKCAQGSHPAPVNGRGFSHLHCGHRLKLTEQLIACSSNGNYQPSMTIESKFRAETIDIFFNKAAITQIVLTPHLIQQILMSQDLTVVSDQFCQKFKLNGS